MWEQYRKNFFGMQLVILLITWGVISRTHRLGLAAIFFLTMEVSAVIGAAGGYRLRKRLQRGGVGSLVKVARQDS